jgi:WD40 repeat protein
MFKKWQVVFGVFLLSVSTFAQSDAPLIVVDNAAEIQEVGVLEGHTSTIYSLAWSPNGTMLASGSDDGTVRLWDMTTNTEKFTLQADNDPIWGVAWSSDSKRVAAAGWNRSVVIWDAESGEQLQTLRARGNLFSVAWSPDDSLIVAGSANGSVQIWDVATEERIQRLEGHPLEVISVLWLPAENTVISGSIDASIRVWDVTSAEELQRLFDPDIDSSVRADVNGMVWSPLGDVIAVARQTGEISLLDTASWTFVKPFALEHEGWARAVAWSGNGEILLSGGEDTQVRVWDVNSGVLLNTLESHTNPIWALAWSPDGTRFVSGSGQYDSDEGEHVIKIWAVGA